MSLIMLASHVLFGLTAYNHLRLPMDVMCAAAPLRLRPAVHVPS